MEITSGWLCEHKSHLSTYPTTNRIISPKNLQLTLPPSTQASNLFGVAGIRKLAVDFLQPNISSQLSLRRGGIDQIVSQIWKATYL